MRKFVLPVLMVLIALAVGVIPLWPVLADSDIRQVARGNSIAKPYSYTKTFSGNALVYDVMFTCHASNTAAMTVTYDCATGSEYDVVVSSTAMSGANAGKVRVTFDPEFYVQTGDKLIIQQANENSAACATQIGYSPWVR